MNNADRMGVYAAALNGSLNRRQIIGLGLSAGASLAFIEAMIQAIPAIAAPAVGGRTNLVSEQESSGLLTVQLLGGTSDLDPQASYSTIGSLLCLNAYEMLIQYKGDSTSEFSAMLAHTWEASDDNTTFTFTIPENAMFHDGTICDAEAVKSSFVRFRRMELGPYNVISRFCDDPENMIEVVDPVTVRFNLGTPQPLFLPAMASSYGPFIVSPTAVEENKSDEDPFAHEFFMSEMVGTGPYRMTRGDINEGYVFERFEEYHGGWEGNHFDELFFRIVPEDATRRSLLESGDVDASTYNLTFESVEALGSNPEVQVLTYPTTRVNWAIMNVPRLKTAEARQGFSYAFPYDDVMEGAYKGLLTRTGPIATTTKGFDPNVFLYQTDLVKAKELILSAGFAEGDTFDYMIPSEDEVERTIAQLFQANVAEMGFNLEIVPVDTATHSDMVYGEMGAEEKPMFIGAWAWWPDYDDPWNQLVPNFVEASQGGNGSNGGGYVNQRFEEIMAEAEHFTSEEQIIGLMKEAQNILTELDPPAIYYGESMYYTILRSDIQGYVANPLYLDAFPTYSMSRAAE